MSKAGAFLTLSGLACLGIGLWMPWDGLFDPRRPFSTELEFVKGPTAASDSKLGMAPNGWRTFAHPPAIPSPETSASAMHRSAEALAASSAALAPHDRVTLVRELQRGLRRMGCYEGELNGAWTQQTRNAMKAFTSRINAALPVDEPDNVLLALVQGQGDKACAIPCPLGEGLAADGRCLPAALLAHAKRPTAPSPAATAPPADPPAIAVMGRVSTTAGWGGAFIQGPAGTLPEGSAPPEAIQAEAVPPEGRMALAGPGADPSLNGMQADAHLPVPGAVQKKQTAFGPSFLRQLDRRGNY